LGDLGVNGMGIPIGKCSLYVAGAGIDPRRCLPIMLDVGTNNESLRNDDVYLGLREARQPDNIFYETLDEFMLAVKEVFPRCLVQFEDFSNNHCFDILSRYRDQQLCFNDDIQGTGTVVAAGIVNAIRLSGIPVKDHRFLFFGAGSAAIGVASAIARLIEFREKIPADEFRKQYSFFDLGGMLSANRPLTPLKFQEKFCRDDITPEQHAQVKTLQDAFEFVKPTIFIGLSGAGRVVTEKMVKEMMNHSKRPIVFPLSNPTSQAEADPSEVYRWSNGTAIVASGSPFPTVFLNEKPHTPSQGNNFYAFPGLGLGSLMCGASKITDTMLTAAANAIAECTTDVELHSAGLLYPRITQIRDISSRVAAAVVLQAQRDGCATIQLPSNKPDLARIARSKMWWPQYETTEFLKDYAVKRLSGNNGDANKKSSNSKQQASEKKSSKKK
jgi:malate dehydrogenase (oxaloacetate-decarboxylating)